MKIEVLDKGYVELIDSMGTDLTVVNAARVSFGAEKTILSEGDKKLMHYLAEHKHHSPFRHNMLQLKINAPEYVLRQWYKHIVGIEVTSSYPTKDHAWNELSQRYRPIRDYQTPTIWRKQSTDNKQASDGIIEDQMGNQKDFELAMDTIFEVYGRMLSRGVAKEQARILLPLNVYTTVIWTASFQAVANLIELRDHDHAQSEIRDYAVALAKITKEIFPETYKAWFERNG